MTPILLAKSNSGVYFLFGSITLATVLVMATYMPETKGRPLESIHQVSRTIFLPSTSFLPSEVDSCYECFFALLSPVRSRERIAKLRD